MLFQLVYAPLILKDGNHSEGTLLIMCREQAGNRINTFTLDLRSTSPHPFSTAYHVKGQGRGVRTIPVKILICNFCVLSELLSM